MNDVFEEYVKQHELAITEGRQQIEEAKEKLVSGGIVNPVMRELFARTILLHERQLQICIKNHEILLAMRGMGE